jgi:hypothetical protein
MTSKYCFAADGSSENVSSFGKRRQLDIAAFNIALFGWAFSPSPSHVIFVATGPHKKHRFVTAILIWT